MQDMCAKETCEFLADIFFNALVLRGLWLCCLNEEHCTHGLSGECTEILFEELQTMLVQNEKKEGAKLFLSQMHSHTLKRQTFSLFLLTNGLGCMWKPNVTQIGDVGSIVDCVQHQGNSFEHLR